MNHLERLSANLRVAGFICDPGTIIEGDSDKKVNPSGVKWIAKGYSIKTGKDVGFFSHDTVKNCVSRSGLTAYRVGEEDRFFVVGWKGKPKIGDVVFTNERCEYTGVETHAYVVNGFSASGGKLFAILSVWDDYSGLGQYVMIDTGGCADVKSLRPKPWSSHKEPYHDMFTCHACSARDGMPGGKFMTLDYLKEWLANR